MRQIRYAAANYLYLQRKKNCFRKNCKSIFLVGHISFINLILIIIIEMFRQPLSSLDFISLEI